MKTLLTRLSIIILLGTVVITPWLLGGVKETTHLKMLVAVTAAFLVSLVALVASRTNGENDRYVLPMATWPILLSVWLAAWQLVSWPRPVAALIAPHNVALHDQLQLDPPITDPAHQAADGILPAPPVPYQFSLRPSKTRHQLSLLAMALAGFWLGTRLFAKEQATVGLFLAVAINGGALALVGMLQMLAGNGRWLWGGRELDVGLPFATFMNRSNAAGYLTLCLAASLMVAVWCVRRADGKPRSKRRGRDDGRRERSARHASSKRERVRTDSDQKVHPEADVDASERDADLNPTLDAAASADPKTKTGRRSSGRSR